MAQFLTRLWPEERAQDLPEYALLLFLICMAAVSTMGGLASRISTVCSTTSFHMTVPTGSASLTAGSLNYATGNSTAASPNTNDGKKRKPAY